MLVDAMGRDQTRRQLAIWPKSQASTFRRDWAEPVQDGVDIRAGEGLDKAVRTLGATPLVVITAGRADNGEFANLPARLLSAQVRLWRTMHAELARLSSDHAHVVASRSDHFIFRDHPLVVTRAVRAVIRAVRDKAPLPPCERLFGGPDVRCLS